MNASSTHIFEALAKVSSSERPLGLSELSRDLGLSAGTTHRALATLEQTGLIARVQGAPRYALGPTAHQLAFAFFTRFQIRDLCIPYLRQLAFASGETTALSVRVGWYAVRIASVPGTKEVVSNLPLGQASTLDESASGKALAAFLGASQLDGFLQWRRKRGPQFDAKALQRELNVLRKRGFSGQGAAFPVRLDGESLAAIAIEGPVEPELLPRCLDIVRKIEHAVAHAPDRFRNHYDHLDADRVELPRVGEPGKS